MLYNKQKPMGGSVLGRKTDREDMYGQIQAHF